MACMNYLAKRMSRIVCKKYSFLLLLLFVTFIFTVLYQINNSNSNNGHLEFDQVIAHTTTLDSTRPIAVEFDTGGGEYDSVYCESEASKVFGGNVEYSRRGEDDPSLKLLSFIKNCRLTPPSLDPYNLTDALGDPSSEQGVRKYVQMELLNGLRNGKFIDCGANDGETISNTLVLERDYNWTGLLIEADPILANNMVKKNRRAWVANTCVGVHNYPHKTKLYRHKNWELVGRVQASPYNKNGNDWASFEVECFPLFSMMRALNLTIVDYLSMDIEGVELEVLQTLPFDKIFVKVFSIETMPSTWTQVRSFMKSKEYNFVKSIRGKFVEDDIFIHKSLLPK